MRSSAGLALVASPALAAPQAEGHWAFQPLGSSPVPETGREAAHPIDAFIVAALEEAALDLSPPADRRTLLRRVTFDLIGLPPTPREVEAFLADGAPDAYARVVDRLLASPRYGERWGRHWLDVARNADTKGNVYGTVEPRFIHSDAYRDWVIGAFNDDLPPDVFDGDLEEVQWSFRETVREELRALLAEVDRWILRAPRCPAVRRVPGARP